MAYCEAANEAGGATTEACPATCLSDGTSVFGDVMRMVTCLHDNTMMLAKENRHLMDSMEDMRQRERVSYEQLRVIKQQLASLEQRQRQLDHGPAATSRTRKRARLTLPDEEHGGTADCPRPSSPNPPPVLAQGLRPGKEVGTRTASEGSTTGGGVARRATAAPRADACRDVVGEVPVDLAAWGVSVVDFGALGVSVAATPLANREPGMEVDG